VDLVDDLAPPDWLDELPLRPGPPWLSMGVHPLDLATWLILDDRFDAELALKAQLLAERHDDVFLARPGSEAAGREVLDLVTAWLTTHSGRAHAPSSAPLDLHPLDRAGRLVQEDLCVLVEHDGRYLLEAGSVCFPSHWRLSEKLGRSVAAIHGPVHHYDVELEARVDRFFDRLRPEHPVVRRNLSIHSHDELFRPEPHESPASFARDVSGLGQVWLRSERQTLVRLPATGAVLFTIKTQQCRAEVLSARPEVAHRLAEKLRVLQPELERTGETVPFPPWLVPWLEAR